MTDEGPNPDVSVPTRHLPPRTFARDEKPVRGLLLVVAVLVGVFASLATLDEPWWNAVLLALLIAVPFVWRMLLPRDPERIVVLGDGTVHLHGSDGTTTLRAGDGAQLHTGVFRARLVDRDGHRAVIRHVVHGRWALAVALVNRGWVSGQMRPATDVETGRVELVWRPRDLPPVRDAALLGQGVGASVAAVAGGAVVRGNVMLGLVFTVVALVALVGARLLRPPVTTEQRFTSGPEGTTVVGADGRQLHLPVGVTPQLRVRDAGSATRTARVLVDGGPDGDSVEMRVPAVDVGAVQDVVAARAT